ncbi:lycopene cyclase domain-containing protein [Candidatus Gottesmanbacteria bacterium]|nr:lycopene cyclase domain-containing protein [Candidatus Gottesmanbacteria bacterium]
MPEYAFILLLLLFITVLLHHRYKVKIYKSRAHLIATNIILLIVGILWDQYAISRGHWGFGQQFLLGPRIGFMPIEEYGFALITVYFVLVVFRIFEKKYNH